MIFEATVPWIVCMKAPAQNMRIKVNILFVLAMLTPTIVVSKDNIEPFKHQIINAVEELSFVDEAFFHDAYMDEDSGDHLGIYFKKKFLEKEDKKFFSNYTIQLCRRIKGKTEFKGKVRIYFYQRTWIRKYNEEGLAHCYISPAGNFSTKVYSRADRYSESILKWTIKSVSGTYNFLFADP